MKLHANTSSRQKIMYTVYKLFWILYQAKPTANEFKPRLLAAECFLTWHDLLFVNLVERD